MSDISSKALIELALDLAQSLSTKDRFDRLLDTVRKTISCDAVALLALRGEVLSPLTLQGLSRDTLGRRFVLSEHPRFQQICSSNTPVRFPADSDLPDPYDGLLIDREGDLPVHACMGLPLYFDHKLIGVLTLDSFTPKVFDDIPSRTLEVISAMAAASLNTALTLDLLEQQAHHSQQVLEELNQAAWQTASEELIGESPEMQRLKQEIALVAPSDFTILIQGETGVGKELVARSLHMQSGRFKAPIVHVNCAALPENLIESELFGHVKGAFTGADKTRAGKFSVADGGTIFLDEIGELPLAAQSKLLRVLQNKEIQALGQDKIQTVDVRVIAATNRDLAEEVEQGRFRADLYHRLTVYPVTVPALRLRAGDVQLLAGYFVEVLKRKLGIGQLKLQADLVSYLNQYDWPGNVRELEHLISRAALKARSRQQRQEIVRISIDDCGELAPSEYVAAEPIAVSHAITSQGLSLREATDNYQRDIIANTLEKHGGSWAAAARELSTDRANLNRLAKRLGLTVSKVISR
ncbi:nitric oxide reductase transcriptional regulator NorR [Agarivorans sp. 1_MG-2023]|uniref:nitric oxide reductase transcriptional regulator NorR n=1 Tax=Agarivorans sp. 1_MG-2023 TaxID=3062634 RepID=UPI0026E1AB2E|nr:nitric oxide reductase transcriptional regulator NorR [Agarivorans sp. 1_MG-2023]MDO6765408.1 nitric oxide reductase transcriptional regulator NorR [Agarivorans sp. 1_MG-2023]